MDINWSWAGLVALTGIIATTWRQIYSFIHRFVGYFVVRVKFDANAGIAVYTYCAETMKTSPFREKNIVGSYYFLRKERKKHLVGMEALTSSSIIFFKKWRFVILSPATSSARPNGVNVNFYCSGILLRGMWNVDTFIKEAVNYYNKRQSQSGEIISRFTIKKVFGRGGNNQRLSQFVAGPNDGQSYGNLQNNYINDNDPRYGRTRVITTDKSNLEIDSISTRSPFETFVFPQTIMDYIEEAQRWLQSGSWYRSKGIPWTRGWLCVGPAGSGKSSLFRSLAQHLDLPIVVFDLASMSNEEFYQEWGKLQHQSPCMALIEDIDGVFHGRTNILKEQGGGLTFDCFLNCVSGVANSEGIFLAITTNNVDLIDSAIGSLDTSGKEMSSRPGRIDRTIYLGSMEETCRRKFARMILADFNGEEQERAIKEGAGMTPAQFSELCLRKCLKRYWEHSDQENYQIQFAEQGA